MWSEDAQYEVQHPFERATCHSTSPAPTPHRRAGKNHLDTPGEKSAQKVKQKHAEQLLAECLQPCWALMILVQFRRFGFLAWIGFGKPRGVH